MIALLLACARAPEPTPAPAPPPVAEPAPVAAPVPTPDTIDWPLYTFGLVPPDRAAPLPGAVADLDLDPRGRYALVLPETGPPLAWDFAGAPTPLVLEGFDGAALTEAATSPFRDEVYVVARAGDAWRIDAARLDGATLRSLRTLHRAAEPLDDLVAPLVRWDGRDRVFFSAGPPGARRVMGLTGAGTRAYEVTSPDGALGERTDPALRAPSDPYLSPPIPLRAPDARPTGVDPWSGSLAWVDGDGAAHLRAYRGADYQHEPMPPPFNWGDDRRVAEDTVLLPHPNGHEPLRWSARDGRLRDAAGKEAAPGVWNLPPLIAANGRTVLGASGPAWTVRTAALGDPLSPVRYATQAALTPAERRALAERRLVLAPPDPASYFPDAVQLYGVYERGLYDASVIHEPSGESCAAPVFASLDGFLEVLHAGFEGVFLERERGLSVPRLRALLDTLSRSPAPGAAAVARVGARLLAGDYDHPDGALVLAEREARSETLGRVVDFADFHPRGPYASEPALQHYFRAFSWLGAWQPSDADLAALRADPAVVEAWQAWTAVQAGLLAPSRRPTWLGGAADPPPYVDPACLPDPGDAEVRRWYPLGWGPDAEALDRTVQHLTADEEAARRAGRSWAQIDADPSLRRTPRECTVRDRVRPNGLDLLAALGSPFARERLAPELARHPDLGPALDRVRTRLGRAGPTVHEGWVELLATVVRDPTAPEGVRAEDWNARLAETALASWATLRHTGVLVNEIGSAEAGAGGVDGFERMETEPVRGVVDPLPEAWEALATVLDRLVAAASSTPRPPEDRVVEVLREAAASARAFGDMARRQRAGEALTAAEYDRIAFYLREIEHPYRLLKSLGSAERDLNTPPAMLRIVDVHRWTDGAGATWRLHAAVGRPQRALWLGSDRGLLVPVRGAVYSYYEVESPRPLDDAAWAAQVDRAKPPPWTVRAR